MKYKKIFPVIAAALLGAPFLGTQVANAASDSTDIKIKVESSLELSLDTHAIEINVSDSGFYSGAVNATVKTNNSTGYFLTMNTGENYNYLKNSDKSVSDVISSITSTATSANFPANSWGFSMGNYDEYYEIPSGLRSIAANPEKTTADGIVMPIGFGVKVDKSLAAGEYTNTIMLTAIANAPAGTTAKAILGSNGNLNFVYDNATYNVGDTYTDNLGETAISYVYDVPTNSQELGDTAWSGSKDNFREDITSVNFDSSFATFYPFSTAYWFSYNRSINSITNTQNLNTAMVTNFTLMFYETGYNARTWSVDLSGWDVSNATDMSGIFYKNGYSAKTWSVGDLSGWDVSNVTNMRYMFDDAGYNATTWSVGDLSEWDVSNVTSMYSMFKDAGYSDTAWSVGDLSEWNVDKVTNMGAMFWGAGYRARTWSIGDLSNWNVSNVTSISFMFDDAGYLYASTWTVGDLSKWNVSNVTDMSGLFHGAGANATTWSVGDLSGWDVSNVKSMHQMFYGIYKTDILPVGDLSGWNVSKVTTHFDFAYSGQIVNEPNWVR